MVADKAEELIKVVVDVPLQELKAGVDNGKFGFRLL